MSELFNKLAAAEAGFLDSEFLSPVLRNRPISIRIAGIILTLQVTKPANFEGWGLFRPLDYHNAILVRQPDAYLMAYGSAIAADLEARRDNQEERIKAALGKAGARYQSYIERGDTYTVEYLVGRERHRSVVKKNNLEVQSAGICLSGG